MNTWWIERSDLALPLDGRDESRNGEVRLSLTKVPPVEHCVKDSVYNFESNSLCHKSR